LATGPVFINRFFRTVNAFLRKKKKKENSCSLKCDAVQFGEANRHLDGTCCLHLQGITILHVGAS
jgi:hypothetical protein